MIATVVNQLAVPITIGFPFNRTLTENGGSDDTLVLGVSERDLEFGEDQGDPAWKRLDRLRQIGSITLALAADANVTGVLDEANEL